MPTNADFLEAVIADPASDGPRLIYADWLEETGNDARAEFIRIQCTLARMPKRERARHPLRQRETDLLGDHRAEWRGPLDRVMFPNGEAETFAPIRVLADIAGSILSFGRFDFAAGFVRRLLSERWEFRRGFAEKLHATIATYLPAAERIHDATPLRSLDLNLDSDGDMSALIECEPLTNLESLRLFGHAETAIGFAELIESRFLGGLKRFGIGDLSLAGFEIAQFSQSALMSQLEELSMSGTGCGTESLHHLLAAPRTAALTALALRGCGREVNWPAVFAAWPECSTLSHLDLSSNPIGDVHLMPLMDRLPAIEDLSLRETSMTEFGLQSLLRSPRIRQLQRLDLSGNQLTDASALDLADSPNLLATTSVLLWGNQFSDRVKEALKFRLGERVTL